MKKEMLSQVDDLTWPIIALLIFVVAFSAVVIRVMRKGATHPEYVHLSNLPLQDDATLMERDDAASQSRGARRPAVRAEEDQA